MLENRINELEALITRYQKSYYNGEGEISDAEFALEELKQTEHLKNKYDGFAEPQPWRAQTKFERKGLKADRQITELYFTKV